MSSGSAEWLSLIGVDGPGILESLARVDAMSGAQIRDFARGEPPLIVEAAESIIAARHTGS